MCRELCPSVLAVMLHVVALAALAAIGILLPPVAFVLVMVVAGIPTPSCAMNVQTATMVHVAAIFVSVLRPQVGGGRWTGYSCVGRESGMAGGLGGIDGS